VKRFFPVFFAILLSTCLLSGCTIGNVSSSDTQQTQTQSAKEPVTLTWMVSSHPSYPYQEDWYAFKKIEEITGVKLKVEAYEGDGFTEKLQIKMASGGLCDVTAGMGRSTAIKYGEEGAFADLSQYMDKLPNFSKWISDGNEGFIKTFKTANQNLYIFPLKGIAAVDQAAFTYRRDIFEKYNLKEPTTYDELYKISKQLKELYPESTPFSFRYNLYNITGIMSRQWNTGGLVYYNIPNDTFQCGYIEENFKAMIEWFRKMYAEKLIPADFMSLNTPGWEQLVSNDLTFMCSDNILRIDTFNNQLRPNYPEFTMAYMTPPKGDVSTGVNKIIASLDSSGFCVASESANLNEALRVLDMFYIPEVADRLSYGEENVTYKLVDGKKRFIGEEGEFIDIYGVCQIYGLHTVGTYAVIDPYSEVGACGACDECNEGYERVKNDVLPYEPVVNFTGDTMKEVADLETIINTYAEEMIAKFILGTEPMSNWDNYVAEIKKLGIDKLVKYYNDTYKGK
jgi:putative aldouronate transport system substrate-binding protein